MGIFLDELLGEGNRQFAEGWDGDYFLLLERSGGEDGLVWVSVWDSETQRDRFQEAVRGGLDQLPLPASLRSGEALGLPSVTLGIGVGRDVSVEVVGR
jgi:hypothetical protein